MAKSTDSAVGRRRFLTDAAVTAAAIVGPGQSRVCVCVRPDCIRRRAVPVGRGGLPPARPIRRHGCVEVARDELDTIIATSSSRDHEGERVDAHGPSASVSRQDVQLK